MTLPLSAVCAVTVNISPISATTPTFNQGLIVGPSTIIPTATRIVQYFSLADLTTAGFTTAHPEFLAAQMYFSQTPTPTTLWVGRQDLTASESALVALQACRAASPSWWACLVTDAVTADHIAIAAWVQAASPASFYFYTTPDAAVLAGTGGNVMITLNAALYTRDFGVYSTLQSGGAPNNAYAAAAAMGRAMGLNTSLANSNFTMKFKQLVGVIPEPITLAQATAIEAMGGNVYVGTANVYTWLEQGKVPSGQFFDEILNLDMLAADFQFSIANLLIASPSVPHTNAGQAQLLAQVDDCCERAVTRGALSAGVWKGQTVLGLTYGTPLPKGYFSQSQSISLQSDADRTARKSQPIYCSIVEAGSMHSVVIGVYVQR